MDGTAGDRRGVSASVVLATGSCTGAGGAGSVARSLDHPELVHRSVARGRVGTDACIRFVRAGGPVEIAENARKH